MFVNHVHLMPNSVRGDATLEAFDRIMARFSFEGAVCFAPFSSQTESIKVNHNVWLHRQINGREDLIGYGTLDPKKDPGPQVELIAELGFKGIKLHPPHQRFDIFGSWSREAYAAMEEHGLIADFHLGIHWYRMKEYDPLLCDEIAHAFPRLKMVFEHVGGWHFYRQVLGVITNNSKKGNHLYAGIASVLDPDNQRYWYLGPEGLNDCLWQIGEDLLIYGLDFPYNQEHQIQRDLHTIAKLDWPEKQKEKLLGGNLKRLLGLSQGAASIVGGDPVHAR